MGIVICNNRLFFPAPFVTLKEIIKPTLGMVMFCMALTLRPKDFAEVIRHPLQVIVGVFSQFLIMPLLALFLTKVFDLEPMIALGIILVGCCPGGTASNVITYLAKGDVALSVTITSITTLLAPFVTPLLLQLYAGSIINIDVTAMMLGIVQMVIFPIILGVVVQYFFAKKISFLLNILPVISVSGLVLIIAVVVGLSHTKIASTGLIVLGVVILQNIGEYFLGYAVGRLMGFNSAQRRAIMIEVGMQNSGLGAALAATYFSNPLTAVPSAIFSVWHNISGALLANICSIVDKKK